MEIIIYEPNFLYEGHQYHTPDGTELQSVTSICKAGLGLYQHKRVSPAAQKGTHIHQAIQYYDEGDLNEETLDAIIKPYLQNYKSACKEKGIVRLQNEVRRYSPRYLFAGTIDIIAKINGAYAIIDIKSGKQENWHKWQTAGYAELMLVEIGPMDRYCLYLTESEYALVKHEEENNFREFLSLMVVADLKKRNGY